MLLAGGRLEGECARSHLAATNQTELELRGGILVRCGPTGHACEVQCVETDEITLFEN